MPVRSPIPRRAISISLAAVAGMLVTIGSPRGALGQPDYRRAEQFLTWNELRLVYGEYVVPAWMKDGSRFWYRVTTPAGADFVVVDPASANRSLLFDNARLAAAISRAADTTYD